MLQSILRRTEYGARLDDLRAETGLLKDGIARSLQPLLASGQIAKVGRAGLASQRFVSAEALSSAEERVLRDLSGAPIRV
jgi:hypothetical protein